MIACIFSPIECATAGLTSLADGFLSLFPFGFTGLVFFAGLIVGERLGKWGVMAIILGWVAYRFGSAVNVAHPDNPTQPTKRALTADEVRALQHALNARGFKAGSEDGKPGRNTRAAISRYQESRGEVATGTPTSGQLKALGVWR